MTEYMQHATTEIMRENELAVLDLPSLYLLYIDYMLLCIFHHILILLYLGKPSTSAACRARDLFALFASLSRCLFSHFGSLSHLPYRDQSLLSEELQYWVAMAVGVVGPVCCKSCNRKTPTPPPALHRAIRVFPVLLDTVSPRHLD